MNKLKYFQNTFLVQRANEGILWIETLKKKLKNNIYFFLKYISYIKVYRVPL